MNEVFLPIRGDRRWTTNPTLGEGYNIFAGATVQPVLRYKWHSAAATLPCRLRMEMNGILAEIFTVGMKSITFRKGCLPIL